MISPNLLRSAAIVPLALILGGCATPTPPAPQFTTISARVPVITALAESPEAQEKGGLEIAVVPALYRSVRKEKVTLTPMQPGMGGMVMASLATGGNGANQVYVEETVAPYLSVEPGHLQFSVRVSNKLSRVFRGQGAVVQWNVGGRLVPFDQLDYAQFANGIVPPRNEGEFSINGPLLSDIPESGTIGIFLYDVVTATDVAGNVTERQNYEWYFDYTTKTVEEEAQVKVGRGFIDLHTYQQRMIEQASEAQRGPR